MFTKLSAATWGEVGKAKEKGFFDFDLFSWMAWTWQTAAFFIFIALCIIVMLIWEKKVPGGSPRKGILGLDTTRGDRLFVSLLGSAFIHLAWLHDSTMQGRNICFLLMKTHARPFNLD